MNHSKVEFPVWDREVCERFIEPEDPEAPLIFMRRTAETSSFEAVFAVELAGVTRRADAQESPRTPDDTEDIRKERYVSSLLPGLSDKQELDFIYTGGKDKNGDAYFKWQIKGHSRHETEGEAAKKAQLLWQNLKVVLGAIKDDYQFIPIKDRSRLEDCKGNGAWVVRVKPVGIGVSVDRHIPMGFNRHEEHGLKGSSVIAVPQAKNCTMSVIDPVVTGFAGCPSEVRVMFSLTPVRLSDSDSGKVASALRWLRNGELKQISCHHDIKEGIEDGEILKGLHDTLNLWLINPHGFRIECSVMSVRPVPSSFLDLAGRIFNAPLSVLIEREETARAGGNGLLCNDSGRDIIDLQDCINSASQFPQLFPGVKVLSDCGAKRVYRQQAKDISNDGILLGHRGGDAMTKEVRFSRADRSRHCYIIGATGTGKSTLLYNMIRQDIENGEGVTVIDPHGDLYRQVLGSIPANRIDDVVVINPCDFDYAAGLNFLECGGHFKNVQMNFVVNEMIKIFDRLYDLRQTGGPMFETYMRNALLLAMDNDFPGATLMDIPAIFEDRDYRKFLIDRCHSQIVKTFWTNQAEKASGETSLENIAPYITCKLNQFTSNALLRPIIGQSNGTINFLRAMNTGKIVLVNLSKGLLGELDSQLLGMLIIGKAFSSAMGRVVQRPENRKPILLYIDEFQNFTTDSVAHLLSEARKFGIHLTLANQNLSQLNSASGKQNILDSIMGNVGSMIILRMGAMDAEKMAAYTKPELDAQDLQELPDFHAAARLLYRNAPGRPFVFKTLPMTHEEDMNIAYRIIDASRKNYARPTSEVEKEIAKRRNEYQSFVKRQC